MSAKRPTSCTPSPFLEPTQTHRRTQHHIRAHILTHYHCPFLLKAIKFHLYTTLLNKPSSVVFALCLHYVSFLLDPPLARLYFFLTNTHTYFFPFLLLPLPTSSPRTPLLLPDTQTHTYFSPFLLLPLARLYFFLKHKHSTSS